MKEKAWVVSSRNLDEFFFLIFINVLFIWLGSFSAANFDLHCGMLSL